MIAPLLSIITVNYNNKSGLIRTLNSIKNQESVFFEHIIIDANSTDGSKDAILLYEKEITFPLYWVSEPDNGIYDGMNKGIKQAHGEYLFFLNSGDTLISNTILQEIALDGNKYIYGNIKYILSEKDWIKKMEIMYYLNKRGNVYFDNSVVFKTELLKLFLDNTPELNFDENMLITACLLCNCKKVDNFTDLNKIRTYAKDGADYLETLGFDKRFCKICEQVNRYTGSEPREPEADVLELIDQFGGMLLDRPERIGFKVDEALVLLEYRNLKGKQNRYLEIFKDFVNRMEAIKVWV